MNNFETSRTKAVMSKARSCAGSLLLLCTGLPSFAHASQKPESPDPKVTASPAPAVPITTVTSALTARQAQIQFDTEHLDRLVRELQAEIAKSDQTTLSLSLVKKTEEIEKLARNLKKNLR